MRPNGTGGATDGIGMFVVNITLNQSGIVLLLKTDDETEPAYTFQVDHGDAWCMFGEVSLY